MQWCLCLIFSTDLRVTSHARPPLCWQMSILWALSCVISLITINNMEEKCFPTDRPAPGPGISPMQQHHFRAHALWQRSKWHWLWLCRVGKGLKALNAAMQAGQRSECVGRGCVELALEPRLTLLLHWDACCQRFGYLLPKNTLWNQTPQDVTELRRVRGFKNKIRKKKWMEVLAAGSYSSANFRRGVQAAAWS